MDKLPVELLENTLDYLAVEEVQPTERFATLTAESRKAILNARLVCRAFMHSKALRQNFVTMIEQTPFLRIGNKFPGLDEFSRSQYAVDLTVLSFCSLSKAPENGLPTRYRDFLDSMHVLVSLIAPIFQRLSNLKHFRYYPMAPRYLHGKWESIEDGIMDYHWVEPPVDNRTMKTIRGEEFDSDRRSMCRWLETALLTAHIDLDSFEMPLLGNRASWCAMNSFQSCFIFRNMKRVSLNLPGGQSWAGLLPRCVLCGMKLEYLEIAVSRREGEETSLRTHDLVRDIDFIGGDGELVTIPTLKEFRFQADNSFRFNPVQFITSLTVFPNLTTLGLGNILFAIEGDWERFLSQLQTRDQRLEELLLMNPGYAVEGMGPPPIGAVHLATNGLTPGVHGTHIWMAYMKYEGHEGMDSAAEQVRLVHANVALSGRSWYMGSGVEYPGFSIFEEN